MRDEANNARASASEDRSQQQQNQAWFGRVAVATLYPDKIDDGTCRGGHCGSTTIAADAYNDQAGAAIDKYYQDKIDNEMLGMGAGLAAATVCGVISSGVLSATCAGAVAGGVGVGTEKALNCSDGVDAHCGLLDYLSATGQAALAGAIGGFVGSLAAKVSDGIIGKLMSKIGKDGSDIDAVLADIAATEPEVDAELGSSAAAADRAATEADAEAAGSTDGASHGSDTTGVSTKKAATGRGTSAHAPGGGSGTHESVGSGAAAKPITAAPERASIEVTPARPQVQSEAAAPSPGCLTHSFTGSTKVVMADGSSKPIEQVKVGDVITDAVPGQTTTQKHTVTNVIVTTTDHDFVDIGVIPNDANSSAAGGSAAQTVSGSKTAFTVAATVPGVATAESASGARETGPAPVVFAGGTLTTTYHHPFYDITQTAFVDADNLHIGDLLQTTTGTAQVTTLRLYHQNAITYDLTIGDLHTYYVEAGDTPVLVHNCDGNIDWVSENTSRSSAANDYEAGATGARSRISTQTREVPALDYINLEGDTRAVKFDGFDESTNTLIDRKMGVATTEKTQRIAINQSMALEQNGYNGLWEVATQRAANRATRMFNRLGINNIDVQVVAP